MLERGRGGVRHVAVGDLLVEGRGETGFVTLTTVSGSIEAVGVTGEIETTTVSGDVEISKGRLRRARMKATNGTIEVDVSLAADGRLDAETLNGDVEVILATAENLELDLETFNGRIETCFGLTAERQSRYGPGRLLRASLGDPDRRVRIKTVNGDVEVCDED